MPVMAYAETDVPVAAHIQIATRDDVILVQHVHEAEPRIVAGGSHHASRSSAPTRVAIIGSRP